jgi:hypothetical protein
MRERCQGNAADIAAGSGFCVRLLRELLRVLPFVLMVASLEMSTAASEESKDIVEFANGDKLTGTISGATSETVIFSNQSVGSLNLKWGDLRSVTFSHPIKITSRSEGSAQGRDFGGGVVYVAESGTKLDLRVKENSESQPVLLREVQSVNGLKKCDAGLRSACPGWQLDSAKISVAFLEATQTDQNYGGSVTSFRTWNADDQGWPYQRTLVELQASYDDKRKNSKPGSANITQEYDGMLQHLMAIKSSDFYAATVADLYHNNSLGLYFEQSYGGGFGGIWHDFELNADLRFIGQHFYGANPSTSLIGSQLSERRTIPLSFIKQGVKLVQTGKYTPVFNMSAAWQLFGRLQFVAPITTKLQFVADVSDSYVENAPSPFRKNYLKTTLGLQFTPNPKK